MDHPEGFALRSLSAALGRNRLRTQAAGGNTSIKRDGVMWIKASGCWLANALDQDIMVPVNLDAMRAAVTSGDAGAEDTSRFVIDDLNLARLRPSIETSVHAILRHAVVAHIHCVETIALAVRTDAPALVAQRLRDLDDVVWAFVPYRRPGLPLALAIRESARPEVNVLILANHGLVVAGENVAEVETRLDRVCRALATTPRRAPTPDLDTLQACVIGSEYRLPGIVDVHALGLDSVSLSLARGGSLYPDHVIFLGPGIVIASDVANGSALRPEARGDASPPMLVLPGIGVVLHLSTNASADAMALCLADVVSRIPHQAQIERLSMAQEYELTHWEAEKYRQSIDAKVARL